MSKRFNVLVGLNFAICTLAMIWPGALLANRIEPLAMGLPFLFFWYVAWILVLFIGMCIAYYARHVKEGA